MRPNMTVSFTCSIIDVNVPSIQELSYGCRSLLTKKTYGGIPALFNGRAPETIFASQVSHHPVSAWSKHCNRQANPVDVDSEAGAFDIEPYHLSLSSNAYPGKTKALFPYTV